MPGPMSAPNGDRSVVTAGEKRGEAPGEGAAQHRQDREEAGRVVSDSITSRTERADDATVHELDGRRPVEEIHTIEAKAA